MSGYRVYYDRGADYPWTVYFPVVDDSIKGFYVDARFIDGRVYIGCHGELPRGTSVRVLGRRVWNPPQILIKSILSYEKSIS